IRAASGILEPRHESERIVASVATAFNQILERELSGYRFVSGVLTRVVEEVEVDEIRAAVAVASERGFDGSKTHLVTALRSLGQKPEPDYRNTCKEAISAVESVVRQLTGEKELSKALDRLTRTGRIHGAFRAACEKLYGYTSDEDGIRHAI